MLPGKLNQRTSLGEGYSEGLVDDNIFAGAKCPGGQRKMAVVGRGDDDQVDIRVGRYLLWRTDRPGTSA
jgi:hypothetical protein